MSTQYDIVKRNDHYEVYKDGQFMCSADDVVEAANEIEREENNTEV